MIKWEKVRLSDVSSIKMGQSPESSSYNTENNGIPFYQGNADFGDLYPKTRYYCSIPTRIAQKNDVLISVRAPIGALNIASHNCCIGRGLAAITGIENVSAYMYIYYFLKSKIDELTLKGTGSTFKAINKDILNNVQIPLPPLDVQKKIAQTLDVASELIALRKQQLAELDILIKATFYDMFGNPMTNEKGWRKITLGNLGIWRSGGTPSRSSKSYFEGDIPWYSSGELENMYVFESKEHISHEALNQSAAKLIEPGSLLLGMYDIAALKSSIVVYESSCNQAIAFSKLNTKICNTIFVYCIIQIAKDYYRRLQRGVRQQNLNLSMIKDIEILLPPLSIQNQFSEIVTKIEEQKALVKQALAESQHLFDSLMSEYFD